MKRRTALLIALFAASLLSMPAAAAVDSKALATLAKDAPAARDLPFLGRYEGSFILGQTVKAFEKISFPIGPAVGATYDDKKRFAKTWGEEGKVTRTLYVAPEGRSTLEVFRNYQNELTGKSWKIAYQCAGPAQCGESFLILKYDGDNRLHTPVSDGSDQTRTGLVRAAFNYSKDYHYALFQKGSGKAAEYVAVFVGQNAGGAYGDSSDALRGRPTVLVEALQRGAMEQRIVTIKAEAIGQELAADGSIAFYGIYFDTDKAAIKPASTPQLAEMARYLKASPSAKVYIVGHTDNQGGLDYNMSLSGRRALAVVDALIKSHGITPARLAARGVGPLAPVASNREEAGRSKNRRVEMVLQ